MFGWLFFWRKKRQRNVRRNKWTYAPTLPAEVDVDPTELSEAVEGIAESAATLITRRVDDDDIPLKTRREEDRVPLVEDNAPSHSSLFDDDEEKKRPVWTEPAAMPSTDVALERDTEQSGHSDTYDSSSCDSGSDSGGGDSGGSSD